MRLTRLFPRAVLTAVAVVAAGCHDAGPLEVEAPDSQPSAGILGGSGGAGLLSCSALPGDSVTQFVGPEGGELRVGPHTLSIPAGALEGGVAITAVVVPEPVNRVRFAPVGLGFQEPASLTMSYANCGLLATLVPKRIAYVQDNGDGWLEIVELIASVDNLLARRVTGPITHFSSYAIAW
jgi:hypothetical protein